jgi:hypothetical protein
MRAGKILVIIGAAVAASVSVGQAIAADFGPPPPPAPPMVAPIAYAPVSYHCARWTAKCDRRWGFGSPRFARCMWRHGC